MFEKLLVLRDDPLFWGAETFDPSRDTFNHEAYAKAIFEVITENKPPLSIGLFGPWGIGKSTVISILFKLIDASRSSSLRKIYFNAWKYSGDSFRRQFLIEAAKQIYQDHPDREARVGRLEQLNYTEVLRKERRESITEQVKGLLRTEIRLRPHGLTRVSLAALVLIVAGILTAVDHSVYPLLAAFLPVALVFLMSFKFEDLFLIQENPVYDPRLIFPEQFEAEFQNLVGLEGPLGKAKAVVVIDDIDRCEPMTVRDILVSIKTFLGNESCFFVVPCDDKSIVQVFQDPNQKQGYEQELLRKYFNVGVRMAPLMGTDLVDFANNVSRETRIPQGVVQMAILANCRDARKMKHFLNSLAVKYAIAKARKASGFMPVDIDKNLPGFAKAVLIEDLYPNLFAKLVEHPDIYEHLSRAALGVESAEELKRFNLQDWDKNYPGLSEILKRTRDIKIENIEVFLSLKTTNPEARIPKGFELKNAIVQGDEAAIEEITKQITSDEAKSNLGELLTNLLNTTTDTFLKNTISTSLRFYCEDGRLAISGKSAVARAVSDALLSGDGQRALHQRADYALQCAREAGAAYLLDELVDKYDKELAELDQPPEGLAQTINALFRFTSHPDSLASVVNKKLDGWSNNEKGLVAILQLQVPKELKDNEMVPSIPLLEKIATAISPEATDSAVALNNLRKQALFKNWHEAISPILSDRLLTMLKEGQSDSGYSKRLAFVVDTIIDNEGVLEPKSAPLLWPLVQNLYSRITDVQARSAIHKVVLIFAARCPEPDPRQAARTFALQTWQSFDADQLKDALNFLERFEDATRTDLQRALVKQELAAIQNELQNPTDRTLERLALCFENKKLVDPGAVESLLLKALEAQDTAFNAWKTLIPGYAEKLGQPLPQQVAEQCLSLVTSSHSQPRRQGFFELFATVLPAVEAEARPHLLQLYFALCKHADPNVRHPAATVLKKVRSGVDDQDFKLGVNGLVRELCRMTPAEVNAHRPVLDGALEHTALFGEYEWRDLADLAKRAIQQADVALQDYGLSLVERMAKIPSDHEEDLVHLLVGVARGVQATQKERADKILRRMQLPDLGPNARHSLEEYLSPPPKDSKEKEN